MSATVVVNFMTVVHKKSTGMVAFFPDVCLTPAPPAPAPIPIPYPNIAQSSDTDKGSKKVEMDKSPIMLKDAVFKKSNGDEPGTAKGVVSHNTQGKAEFVMFSMDVKVEGKSVTRFLDVMVGNELNGKPPNTPFPELQAPLVVSLLLDEDPGEWDIESIEEKE